MFYGRTPTNIDEKRRLYIPVKILEMMGENVLKELMVVDFEKDGVGIFSGMSKEDIFKQLPDVEAQSRFLRDMMDVSPPDNKGRILIPKGFGSFAGKEKVTVVGNGNMIFLEPNREEDKKS